MLADLHCHYPMHLLAREPREVTLEGMTRIRRRPGVEKLRAWIVYAAARLLNFRRWSGTWRVTLDGLEHGDVGVVLSVLYQPFDEMELYGRNPAPDYFSHLVDQLEGVEDELARTDPRRTRHVIVRTARDLDEAIETGRIAFVHCVEGGFHLGSTPDDVRAHVHELARRGVAYVTLAHLFWRRIATNAPAIPFLGDHVYSWIFRQPRGEGLTELGDAAVEAMYDARMLIDISHMREEAIDDTFALLAELDRRHGAEPSAFPVIASHSAFRFGDLTYNVDARTVRRIAGRDGVIGLILAQHQLNEGIRRLPTRDLEESLDVICRHVDVIHDITGSHRHVAIGSDLDGFIKPTVGGIESAADMALLRDALAERYGPDADRILSGNALRILRAVL